jgi:hypothetical protein
MAGAKMMYDLGVEGRRSASVQRQALGDARGTATPRAGVSGGRGATASCGSPSTGEGGPVNDADAAQASTKELTLLRELMIEQLGSTQDRAKSDRSCTAVTYVMKGEHLVLLICKPGQKRLLSCRLLDVTDL